MTDENLKISLEKDERQSLELFNSNKYSTTPIPWRRYFARLVDASVSVVILTYIICFFIPSIRLDSPLSGQLFLTVVSAIGIVIESAIISKFGTTFGKWLFSIKIYDSTTYDKLPFSRALNRSFTAFFVGCGIYISIIYLFTSIYQFTRLNSDSLGQGRTSWDKEFQAIVVHGELSEVRILLASIIIIAYFVYFANPYK